MQVQGVIEPEESQLPDVPPDYESTGILPDDMGIVEIPEDKPTIIGRRPPAPGSYSTGQVGDIIPIVPAREVPRRPVEPPKRKYQPPPRPEKPNYREEEVARRQPPSRGEPPSRREVPLRRDVPSRREPPSRSEAPPRRGSDTEVIPPEVSPLQVERVQEVEEVHEVEPAFSPPAESQTPSEPEEGLNWVDAPPPVRAGQEKVGEGLSYSPSADQGAAAVGEEYQGEPVYELAQPSKRRRARWMILTLSGIVVVALVGSGTFLVKTLAATESKRITMAQRDYDDGKYGAAIDKFEKLRKDYPKSDKADWYDFFASLSEVRDQVYRTDADPEEALQELRQFAKRRAGDPLLQENSKDIWLTYLRSIEDVSTLAQQNLSGHFEISRRLLSEAQKALEEAKLFAPKDQTSDDTKKLVDQFGELDLAITKLERRDKALAEIKTLHSTPEDILQADRRGRQEGIQDDPEFKRLIKDLKEGLISQVSYEASPAVPPPQAVPEFSQPGLLVAPRLGIEGVGNPAGNGVVLAVVRGILYALAEKDGALLWATRLGVDASRLPVKLPATETAPEMVLVVSAETNVLTARDLHSGKVLWHYDLHAPCIAQPLVIGLRAYVPTLDGKVHEIEIVTGHLLGWYKLGLPMTVGGAHWPGSDLVYFPADSLNVYVLDVRQKKCVGILQSGHSSGTLRSPPILVGGFEAAEKDPNASGEARYLVLSQSAGLEAMKLRAFSLPIEGTAPISALQPEPRIRGWSWFPPFSDEEKVVLATDAGVLGLFGIQQHGNDDTPIYRESAQEVSLGSSPGFPVRSQVIQVHDDDLWVLANGNLQWVHFDKYLQKVVPVWNRPLALGIPLHAAQVDEKTKTLFTVTQSITKQTCLATAVSASDGQIRWQRQLGMVAKGDPILLGSDLLALDQGGALFRFDTNRASEPSSTAWQTGVHILAESMENLDGEALLLAGPDGRSAYEVACVKKRGQGGEPNFDLLVRRFEAGKDLVEKTFSLTKARLHGTPGLMGGSLLVPLDDGSLLRQPLDGGRESYGPGWRARHADEGARGHVVVLGPEDFLTTDGSRGLSRWHWPNGDVYKEERRVDDLPHRLVTAPLVIPGKDGQADFQVCVADAGGFIRLLSGAKLEEIRHWDLGGSSPSAGRVTAGPFLRGNQVLCVVNQRRLVSIDPNQEKPAWEYSSKSGDIVGRPKLMGDMIVVADAAGRVAGLDPATGKEVKPGGFLLGANVAPTASPVPFYKDRIFVPLTDGTVFFLSLSQLHHPAN